MAERQAPDDVQNTGIRIRNLYKIFGGNPSAYVDLVRQGMSKAELNEKHGHVLGLKDINIEMPSGKLVRVVMYVSLIVT